MAQAKKNEKQSDTASAPEGTATAQQQDPMALSIGDLKNLSTILDVASTRGAFKASEMAGVGFIYNKLTAFLQKVEGDQKAAAAQQTAPEKK